MHRVHKTVIHGYCAAIELIIMLVEDFEMYRNNSNTLLLFFNLNLMVDIHQINQLIKSKCMFQETSFHLLLLARYGTVSCVLGPVSRKSR